ncbi:MAG: hypothetical protein KDA78_07655 [Planctomycetaceae bacterium]|nr:hypothetical protein [Planctomycetaceae bacterium]
MKLSRLTEAVLLWASWRWRSRHFRWSHKPLCQHYHQEVLHLGPYHLCRSCTLLIAGLLTGGLTGFLLASHSTQVLLWGGLIWLPVLLFSWPESYRNRSRFQRDFLRSSAGVLAGLLLSTSWLHSLLVGVSFTVLLLILRAVYLSRRSHLHTTDRCLTCPDYHETEVCPGFEKQSLVALEFEEFASERAMKCRGFRN